jgi:hypothetical protein
MRHGPDLLKAQREAMFEHRARGLGGEALAPAVGMKVPSDLDLPLSVRQRLQQHGPRGGGGGALDDRPGAKARILGEAREVLLDQVNRLATVLHRRAAPPPDHLDPAVYVEQPISFLLAPRSDR